MDKKTLKKLLKVIPGGSHTYSRGFDQFPSNAPTILKKGKGAYVYTDKNKKLLDYGMGLRSVNIGYSEKSVLEAVRKSIENGNNLTLPSTVELEAAQLILKLIKSADMVKFAKNGSTAVTAAIKLARAYTGREKILICKDHPFFSYDDWFISSTPIKRGIPNNILKNAISFKYNSINEVKKKILKYKNKIAALVLEPSHQECPYKKPEKKICCGELNCEYKKKKNFLQEIQTLCKKNNIVFILDEMITGFRWDIHGAQNLYKVKPDLSTFGKAMANGFSISALCGKREIMKLGSIEFKKKERVFLISSTFGAEMSSLAAFLSTIKFIKKNNVINKNWDYGKNLKKIFNDVAKEHKIEKYIYMGGINCSPFFVCKNEKYEVSLDFRTLLMQEMIKCGILLPNYISISYSHGKKELEITKKAIKKSFIIYKKALKWGVKKYLEGDSIKPVFRKYN